MKLNLRNNDQKGFAAPLVVLLALAITGAVGYYAVVFKKSDKPILQNEIVKDDSQNLPVKLLPKSKNDVKSVSNTTAKSVYTSAPSNIPKPSSLPKTYTETKKQRAGLFGQQCDGSGVLKLKTFPIDVENIELIVPMGRVQDSHVTPTDHQYIIPVGTQSGSLVTDNPRKYEIKAPADGHIITIELFKEPVESQYRNQAYSDNYLVIFEHSCDFYTRLIHIDTLSARVLASFQFKDPNSQHPYASTRISVKEGEIIGTIGSHSFDFQIMNALYKDKNFISPQNIDWFSAYTVDTFDYLSEPLRGALLRKNMIKHTPLGGRIGYDVLGTLAGNWFLVGRGTERENYWTKNMSIVYDHIDPTQIRISLGNFGGYPKAYGVRGNSPDPASVKTGSGVIKYELVKFDYYSGNNKWDSLHFAENLVAKNTDEIVGTVLFELVDDKKLKMEVFPGQTSDQVSGFTSAALFYER